MKPRRVLTPHNATAIFDRAVQERALAVLTLQDGQEWQTFKSRFLERDPKTRFFVLDYEAAETEPLPVLTPGLYVGVSFRQKARKFLFATVVEAKGRFVLDNRQSVSAVRYRWPDSMTELQRRAYYRTPVPSDVTLHVGLWLGGAPARARAQEGPFEITTGDLLDLSCGGALIRLHQAVPPPWNEGQTLGLELPLPDGRPATVVDVRYRGCRADDTGTLHMAVQFIGLELSLDGRVVLERLANSVQRLNRMNLAAGRRNMGSKFNL